jgi:anaerobic selenocysteine-containing dehydrogenase
MNSTTRRTFLKQAVTASATLAGLGLSAGAAERKAPTAVPVGAQPWYRRTLRWGQTNITEIDLTGYDIAWWRQH